MRYSARWGNQSVAYRDAFEPNFEASFYVKPKNNQRLEWVTLEVMVSNEDGNVYTDEMRVREGLNTFHWNLFHEQTQEYLGKGSYTLTIKKGRSSHETTFEIK